MNIKQAIAQTQRRWLHWATGEGKWERCGFCQYAPSHECSKCPVVRVLGASCGYLNNYGDWHQSVGRHSPDDDRRLTDRQRRLARAVLEDVNKIARHYHCKVVPLPPTP